MREQKQAMHEAARQPSESVAVLTGNRAGIVESANLAWTELTGFPLEETLHKPISHFLEHAGIELDLVDFVAQNFVEGRPSAVEFPFQTFTGRTIRVHLGVESVRNDLGEIDAFRAEAHAVEVVGSESKSPAPARDAHSLPSTSEGKDEIHLSRRARRVCLAWRMDQRVPVMMDFAFDPALPPVRSDAPQFHKLLMRLLDSAAKARESAWGCITILTGQTERNRSHRSEAHPIAVRPRILGESSFIFLEVHDTATHLSKAALARIERNTPNECPREIALAEANAIATAIGLTLHIDSTPGCGTQSLLLFPIPDTNERGQG